MKTKIWRKKIVVDQHELDSPATRERGREERAAHLSSRKNERVLGLGIVDYEDLEEYKIPKRSAQRKVYLSCSLN